jgi:SAM-dependent methyltransferase
METENSLQLGIEAHDPPLREKLPQSVSESEMRLLDTQRAFDSVAVDYDGPRGNNELIQRMRRAFWQAGRSEFFLGSRLLDLGCGTGLDAAEFARSGYRVVATDWSPQMVARTRSRILAAGASENVQVRQIGIQQLHTLDDRFDGIYSNFGPLNCAPDLHEVAAQCARLLRPGGKVLFSVIGRLCPWEIAHYVRRGRFARATVRLRRGDVAVGMNNHTIWTRYYFPREFHRAFSAHFRLRSFRALSLFMPPPYLIDHYHRRRAWCDKLGWVDDRFGHLPLLRGMGDHFLIVMQRR